MKTVIKAEAEVPRKGNEPAWRQRAVSRSLSAARSRAEQRVQRFLDTAFELIDERGTTEFTIQEVVDRSKQSVRAFYQCFDGKDELLLALSEENTRESVEDIREVVEAESDPIARLRAFVIRLHQWCEPSGTPRKRSKHNRRPIAEFSLHLAVNHPDRLLATLVPISRMLLELIEAAVAAGAIEVTDTRRAAAMIQQTVMFGWFGNRLVPNPRMHVTAEEAWDFCLHGLHAARIVRINRGRAPFPLRVRRFTRLRIWNDPPSRGMEGRMDRAPLRVPERTIPVPTTVSPEAQALLAMGAMPAPAYPALDDGDGWRKMIASTDAMVLAMFSQAGLTSPDGYRVEDLALDGVPVYAITPANLDPADTRVFLDIHGGAFIVGGGEVCRATAIMATRKVGMRLWSVDYRMPPDHPHPSAIDDCMVAYRALLKQHQPEEIVVGGTSAGGNLAAALILRARDEGLPLPAAAILLTPALDLTQSGDSFRTNLGVDTVITTNDPGAFLLYAGGCDLKDPYLSPLFGDVSKGFPPTLLASGTRDVLLSDTVRMHRALRAARMPAELHVLEAAPHGFFRGGTPEDRELDREVRRFIGDYCPVRPPSRA